MKPVIFPLPHLTVLERYFEIRDGMRWSETAYSARFVRSMDPVIEGFMHDIALPAAIGVLGKLVRPTYSFLSRYVAGSVLKRHVDRPACIWSISHCVHSDPTWSWPLNVDGEEVRLRVGEAAMFSGVCSAHWRDPLIEGEQVWAHYHFVPIDHEGPFR